MRHIAGWCYRKQLPAEVILIEEFVASCQVVYLKTALFFKGGQRYGKNMFPFDLIESEITGLRVVNNLQRDDCPMYRIPRCPDKKIFQEL